MFIILHYCFVFIIFLAFLFSSDPLFATTSLASPQDIEQSRERSRIIEEEIEQRVKSAPEKTKTKPAVELPTLLPEDECQMIKKIWLYGADGLGPVEEMLLLAPFVDKCASNKDIALVANTIQKWYLDNGYITTRISIKKNQNSLDKGNLEIWVVEGKLGKITMAEESAFNLLRIQSAFSIQTGDILNIHDLDQGLEQLNRQTTQKFKMQINPAEKPAYSDVLLIESAASPYSIADTAGEPHRHWGRQLVTYQYSNSGVEDTGKHLHGLNFTRENLFGANDVLSLGYQRNMPFEQNKKENESKSLGAKMPWGHWYFTLNYSDNATVRKVVGDTATFFSKSSTESSRLSANYMLSRDRNSKLELSGGFEYSDRKNFINNTLVETSSRRISSMDLGAVYTHYFPTSTVIFSLTGALGTHWFGALEDKKDLEDDFPKAQYTLYKLFAYYRQQVIPSSPYRLSLQHTINSQYTSDALYGEKQFILGGEYSIRGFSDNILSSDGGWSLRNDIELPVGYWSQQWSQNRWLIPFNTRVLFDLGRGRPAAGGKDELLSGYGYGVSYQYRWFDISYNRARAKKTSDLFEDDEGWVNYVSASAKMSF